MEFPSEKSAVLSRLLITSNSTKNVFSEVHEISKNLDEYSVQVITGMAEEAIKKNDVDSAERYLTLGERASQYVGDQYTRLNLMAWKGNLAFRTDNIESAQKLLVEAIAGLESFLSKENADTLTKYNFAGLNLVNVYLKKEEYQSARDQLSGLSKAFQKIGAVRFEINTLMNLLQISLSIGDLEAAEGHAQQLIKFPKENFLSNGSLWNPSQIDLLTQLVFSLFKAGNEKNSAIQAIGEFILALDSENVRVSYVLGEVNFDMGQWRNALNFFSTLLKRQSELPPGFDLSKTFHFMSICHSRLGENKLALEKIILADRAKPGDPFLLFAYGQLEEAREHSQEAIDIYTRAIDICKRATGQKSVDDLSNLILVKRAICYKVASKMEEAIADLDELKTRDDFSRINALEIRSDWLIEENNLAAALQCFEEAERFTASSTALYENHLKRVKLLIQLKRFEEALDLLKVLAYKGALPEEAVEQLNCIPTDSPIYQSVTKWLGYALTEAGWPSRGIKQLNQVISVDPHDEEAYHFRALAHITFGHKTKDEEAWNTSLSLKSLMSCLTDLYAALRIAPNYSKAKDTLQWLIERAATLPDLFEIFSHGGTREGDLFSVFPTLKACFQLNLQAFDEDRARNWPKSIVLWEKTMKAFEKAGFPLLASSIHVRLADTYLRLSEMNKVELHLKLASKRLFQVSVPLSEDVRLNYERNIQEKGEGYLPPTAGIEWEYHWIYSYFNYDQTLVQYLNADFRHRLGDIEGALRFVEYFEPYLSKIEDYFESVISLQMVLGIVSIYRAAKEFDKATIIMDFLEQYYKDAPDFQILYSRALIYSAQGNSKQAIAYYKRTSALMSPSEKSLYPELHLQYAAELLNTENAKQALETVEELNASYEGRSDRTKIMYNTVAAYAYAASGNRKRAIECFENGMKIIEQRRMLITDSEGKIGWLGQQNSLIDIGIKLYAEEGNYTHAYEIAEYTKGRVLLEELAGRTTLSTEYQTIVGELDVIEKTLQIANQMQELEKNEEAISIRTELFSKLKNLLATYESLKSIQLKENDSASIKNYLANVEKRIKQKEMSFREENLYSKVNKQSFADLKALLD